MKFSVPADFNISNFIDSARALGCNLESTDLIPNVDGFLVLQGAVLTVNLNNDTQAKSDAVTSTVLSMGGEAFPE